MISKFKEKSDMDALSRFKKTYTSLILAIFVSSTLLSFSILSSCGANMFSVEDDVQIGKEIEAQIKSDPNQFPILRGHQDVKDYVSGLGKFVLQNSKQIKYKNTFPYKIEVIDDDSSINAFAIPGGFC